MVIDLAGEDSDEDDPTENASGSPSIQEATGTFMAQDTTRTEDFNAVWESFPSLLMTKLADVEHQM